MKQSRRDSLLLTFSPSACNSAGLPAVVNIVKLLLSAFAAPGLLLGCAASILTFLPARAAELRLRPGHYYSAVSWDRFPDANALAQPGSGGWRAFLPDLESQALSQITYQESPFSSGHNLAALGLRARANAQLSLIYYSPAGYSYLIRRALPLPRSGRLFAELELPAAESGGLIRALLWAEQPDLEALARMQANPLGLNPAVSGLVGQSWITRAAPNVATPPWLDPYDITPAVPLGFDQRQWPLLFARLDSGGQPVLKDCVVKFDGTTTPDSLDLNSYVWPLRWGDELLLSFAIPPERETHRAELRLDLHSESSPASSSNTEFSELLIEVNGWSTSELDFGPAFGSLTQPAGISVSHYLRPGVNQVRLRAPAQAGQSWMIRRIELWMD